jgi:predicted nucleic acid-binding protein
VLASRERWVSDSADDPIVETALQGGAAVVVTGDKRLLDAEVPGVKIVTVAEMIERLAES